jgi:hypothetical protein
LNSDDPDPPFMTGFAIGPAMTVWSTTAGLPTFWNPPHAQSRVGCAEPERAAFAATRSQPHRVGIVLCSRRYLPLPRSLVNIGTDRCLTQRASQPRFLAGMSQQRDTEEGQPQCRNLARGPNAAATAQAPGTCCTDLVGPPSITSVGWRYVAGSRWFTPLCGPAKAVTKQEPEHETPI